MSSSTMNLYETTNTPVEENSQPLSKRRILKNLLVVSVGTFFVLAADDIIVTVQSTLNRDKGVGVASVAVQYAFTFLTSLLLPKYMVTRYGCKTNMILFLVLFIPFIVANYYPLYPLMIASALSLGVGMSLFRGALDPYLNTLASLYAVQEIKSLKDSERSAFPNVDVNSGSEPDFTTSAIGNVGYNNINKSIIENSSSDHIDAEVTRQSPTDTSTMEIFNFSSTSNHLGNEIPKSDNVKTTDCNKNDIKIFNVYATSRDSSKNVKKEKTMSLLESTTIRFFGFNSLVNMSCYLFSNVTSFLVLHQGYSKDFWSVTPANGTCSCGAAYCNVETACSEHNLQQPSPQNRIILLSVCVGLWFIAGVIWIVFLDDLKRDKKAGSLSLDLLLATFRQMKKKNHILLIPMTMNTGMLIGFYIADFTKSYIGCAWGIQYIGIATACSGGAMALGALVSGWLARPLGRRPIFIGATALNATLIAILRAWTPTSEYPVVFCVTAMLFGSLYGIYYTQIRAFYGVLFRKNEEAAFAAYQLWYAVGTCFILSISTLVCNDAKIYLLVVSATLGLIGYLIVERSHSLTTEDNASENDKDYECRD